MSRSEDRRREEQAHWKGYQAGVAGELVTSNPFKLGAAAHVDWGHGYARGLADRKRKRMDCSGCDPLSLQRVTTKGSFCYVEFVRRVPGKKPYLARCTKCKREWKTGAEYARKLSGDAFRIQRT